MAESSGREFEIFMEALGLPAGERTAFLNRACGGDEGLRRKIEALLRSNDRTGRFLEQPAATMGESRIKSAAADKSGDRIDRYKLLQQIGEGGCGIVFLAEQEEPVRRRVALKVIKPGMDTKSVIARFEAERQALALMDHPNIARVFDAGTTANGRPYFVMELVEGLKITDYCDQHSLQTGARLELFVQVCEAIQHAHQKGIIHRDIKPSNILVTTAPDGKPVPKVIDFGIAKAIAGQWLTDKTIFTAREMLIGTPAYMSPEQASLSSSEVDTRTDIYSLGVLLYELLTGITPFDTRELLKAGFDEVRRVIREEEPMRPSTRLSTMVAGDLAGVSKHHAEEAPRLIRELRGDLDWVVMKALEKECARRFATANGLAMDIRRYLGGEAVSARPPSRSYKFRKLVGRHKLVFSGVALIFILLVISLCATTSWLLVERQERHQMQQQIEIARLERRGFDFFFQGKMEDSEAQLLKALDLRQQNAGVERISVIELAVIVSEFEVGRSFDKIRPFLHKYADPGMISKTEYVGLLLESINVLAQNRQWNEAQALAEEFVNRYPDEPEAYHALVPIVVENNNVAEYRRLCGEIVSRFGNTTNSSIADRMAKDCLILPSPGSDLKTVAAMADVAVSGESTGLAPYFECCKALAEFREGHFEEAMTRARLPAGSSLAFLQADAAAITAMSQLKLDHPDEAREALADCERAMEGLPKGRPDGLGGDWRDWVFAYVLHVEAYQMINGGTSSRSGP